MLVEHVSPAAEQPEPQGLRGLALKALPQGLRGLRANPLHPL